MKYILLMISYFLICTNQQAINTDPWYTEVYTGSEMMIVISGTAKNLQIKNLTYIICFNNNISSIYSGMFGMDSSGSIAAIVYITRSEIVARHILSSDIQMDLLIIVDGERNARFNVQHMKLYSSIPYEIKNLETNDFVLHMRLDLSCNYTVGAGCSVPCGNYSSDREYCDPIDGRIRYINLTDHQVDRCQNNTCSNWAKCYMNQNVTQCECRPTECGNMCEKPLCKERCNALNGYCHISGVCKCKVGFGGGGCENATCENYNPCQNGARCYIKDNQHNCECDRERYAGHLCELICDPKCEGGTCIEFGKPVCLYDQEDISVTTAPYQKKETATTKHRAFDSIALTTGGILLTFYLLFVISAILYLKGYFDKFKHKAPKDRNTKFIQTIVRRNSKTDENGLKKITDMSSTQPIITIQTELV